MQIKTTINYDNQNDILYISIGDPVPSICEEKEEGIIIRRNIETGKITGVTILDYKEKVKNKEKIDIPAGFDLSKVKV